MSPPAMQPASPLLGEDIHRVTARLRLVAAGIGLALAAVGVVGAVLLVLRALRPVEGRFAAVVAAGAVALAALVGALVALEITGRRAKKAPALAPAAAGYLAGCLIAAGANFAAACVTLVVLGQNGVSAGLWVPTTLVLAVNLLGLLLAIPRVKHLRQLHYRPILPVTRV